MIVITEFQLNNLTILAAYLRTLPKDYNHFSMRDFCITDKRPSPLPSEITTCLHDCGTSACAVGHGPSAGIKPLKGEYWGGYLNRCFSTSTDLFHLLFSEDLQGNHYDAAERIEAFLSSNNYTIIK